MSVFSQVSYLNVPGLTIDLTKNYKNIKPKYLIPIKEKLIIKIPRNIIHFLKKNEEMNGIRKRMKEGQFGVLESLAGFRQKLQEERRRSSCEASNTSHNKGLKDFEDVKIENECSSSLPSTVDSPEKLIIKIPKNIITNYKKNKEMYKIKKRMKDGRFGVLESLAWFRQKLQEERRSSIEVSNISHMRQHEGVKDFEDVTIETEYYSPLPSTVDSPVSLNFSVTPSCFSVPSIKKIIKVSTLTPPGSSCSSSPNTFVEFDKEICHRFPHFNKTKYS